MLLTPQRHSPDNADEFPTAQLAVLALVRLAEPIALTSILPYAWKLVLTFDLGDESHASLYAGFLISAFAFAESLTGMYWGELSDRIGRKPVLMLGCVGTIVSLLIVGLSTNFWVALLGRFIGGALNGSIGVLQTIVGELVTNPKHEPKAFAVMPFVWTVGTIVGPCIGGYFANPATTFPQLISQGSLLGRYPYLLPNLICSALMLVSILAGWTLLQETHPEKSRRSHDVECQETESGLLSIAAEAEPASYGTFTQSLSHASLITVDDKLSADSRKKSVFTPRVTMLIVSLGFLCWHSMSYDHLLPIFLQDGRAVARSQTNTSPAVLFLQSMDGGLGLTTQQTGIIMAVNGLIALFIQAFIFPFMADHVGIWKSLLAVTVAHPLAYFVVPFLAVLPQHWLFRGIYACLTLRSLLSIVAYPLLLILIKEASPSPKSLGKINGLAASVGAASRTFASPLSGFLYTIGMNVHFVAIAWWASSLIAALGIVQFLLIPKRHCNDSLVFQVQDDQHILAKKGLILVGVEEVDSGYNSAEERAPLLTA